MFVTYILDAFDAVHFEAVNKENAEMRRIFLFRFDCMLSLELHLALSIIK